MSALALFCAVLASLGIVLFVALCAANDLLPALLIGLGVVYAYWYVTKPDNAYFE